MCMCYITKEMRDRELPKKSRKKLKSKKKKEETKGIRKKNKYKETNTETGK